MEELADLAGHAAPSPADPSNGPAAPSIGPAAPSAGHAAPGPLSHYQSVKSVSLVTACGQSLEEVLVLILVGGRPAGVRFRPAPLLGTALTSARSSWSKWSEFLVDILLVPG